MWGEAAVSEPTACAPEGGLCQCNGGSIQYREIGGEQRVGSWMTVPPGVAVQCNNDAFYDVASNEAKECYCGSGGVFSAKFDYALAAGNFSVCAEEGGSCDCNGLMRFGMPTLDHGNQYLLTSPWQPMLGTSGSAELRPGVNR